MFLFLLQSLLCKNNAFIQSDLQYTLFIIIITFKIIHFYKHKYLFILSANK